MCQTTTKKAITKKCVCVAVVQHRINLQNPQTTMSKPTGSTTGIANSKVMMNKTQLLQDYKNRLKTSMRSASENIQGLMAAVKVPADETGLAYKNHGTAGRVANYITVKNEVITRSTLIVKACEELLALNNDVKSYTILRDFKAVNEAVRTSNLNFRQNITKSSGNFERFRYTAGTISSSIDNEIQENFYRLT